MMRNQFKGFIATLLLSSMTLQSCTSNLKLDVEPQGKQPKTTLKPGPPTGSLKGGKEDKTKATTLLIPTTISVGTPTQSAIASQPTGSPFGTLRDNSEATPCSKPTALTHRPMHAITQPKQRSTHLAGQQKSSKVLTRLAPQPAQPRVLDDHAQEKLTPLEQSQEALPTHQESLLPGNSLSLVTRAGQQVQLFQNPQGQWQAQVKERWEGCERQVTLPVYCKPGFGVEKVLAYQKAQLQQLIHVAKQGLHEFVYLGSVGLLGGMRPGEEGVFEEKQSGPLSIHESSASKLDLEEPLSIAEYAGREEEYGMLLCSRVAKLTQQGAKQAQKAYDRETIAILGNTGAGKSTFINYLAGCRMYKTTRRELGLIGIGSIIEAENPLMRIGHDQGRSQTLIPQVETDANDLAYCDLPGFADSRGHDISIANAMNIQQVMSAARGIKMVVLASYTSLIEERGAALRQLLEDCIRFFGSAAKFVAHAPSILLGITRVPPGEATLADLQGFMRQNSATIMEAHPEILSTLADRLFIFDPLNEGAQRDRRAQIATLPSIEDPTSTFQAALENRDVVFLNEVSATILNKFCKELEEASDFSLARKCLDSLEDLTKISQGLNGIKDEARRRLERYFDKTYEACSKVYNLVELEHLQEGLSHLRTVEKKFEILKKIDRCFELEQEQKDRIEKLSQKRDKFWLIATRVGAGAGAGGVIGLGLSTLAGPLAPVVAPVLIVGGAVVGGAVVGVEAVMRRSTASSPQPQINSDEDETTTLIVDEKKMDL